MSLDTTIRYATASLKSHNEDAVGSSGSTFWVIDGASSLTAAVGNADVSRFATSLSDALGELEQSHSNASLVELVRGAHEHVLSGWREAPAAAVPTASLVVARFLDDAVEFFILGDCSGYVRRGTDIAEVSDPQFHNNEKGLLEQVRFALRVGIAPDDAYALLIPELLERRQLRNTSGGKWILGADPEAAHYGRSETFLHGSENRVSVILMTDGYRRAWDTYGLTRSLGEFLEQTENDPHDVIRRIREIEQTDPERTEHLRLSVSDDATAMSVSRRGVSPPLTPVCGS